MIATQLPGALAVAPDSRLTATAALSLTMSEPMQNVYALLREALPYVERCNISGSHETAAAIRSALQSTGDGISCTAKGMGFRAVAPLATSEFAIKVRNDTGLVKIVGGQHWRSWDMDVAQATLLRDWLNAALPVPESKQVLG